MLLPRRGFAQPPRQILRLLVKAQLRRRANETRPEQIVNYVRFSSEQDNDRAEQEPADRCGNECGKY